jgi:hypothetical protein
MCDMINYTMGTTKKDEEWLWKIFLKACGFDHTNSSDEGRFWRNVKMDN